jgi:hypothetical protein
MSIAGLTTMTEPIVTMLIIFSRVVLISLPIELTLPKHIWNSMDEANRNKDIPSVLRIKAGRIFFWMARSSKQSFSMIDFHHDSKLGAHGFYVGRVLRMKNYLLIRGIC